MRSFRVLALLTLILFSCDSTKVTHYPKYLGLRYSESLLITEIQYGNRDFQFLPFWAKEKIQKEIPSIQVTTTSEIDYKMRQYGVDLNLITDRDTLSFKQINEKAGISYLLISRILSRNDNNFGELHNPQYNVKQAVLEFKLIDLKSGSTLLSQCNEFKRSCCKGVQEVGKAFT
jgi:hypothetical protein